jgi:hypothetical protein
MKKGLIHDDQIKSISFLQAVHDPAYIDVITTLRGYINTFQSEDFGNLPPNICMMGLAAQMNKNSRVRVREVSPHAQQVD